MDNPFGVFSGAVATASLLISPEELSYRAYRPEVFTERQRSFPLDKIKHIRLGIRQLKYSKRSLCSAAGSEYCFLKLSRHHLSSQSSIQWMHFSKTAHGGDQSHTAMLSPHRDEPAPPKIGLIFFIELTLQSTLRDQSGWNKQSNQYGNFQSFTWNSYKVCNITLIPGPRIKAFH